MFSVHDGVVLDVDSFGVQSANTESLQEHRTQHAPRFYAEVLRRFANKLYGVSIVLN